MEADAAATLQQNTAVVQKATTQQPLVAASEQDPGSSDDSSDSDDSDDDDDDSSQESSAEIQTIPPGVDTSIVTTAAAATSIPATAPASPPQNAAEQQSIPPTTAPVTDTVTQEPTQEAEQKDTTPPPPVVAPEQVPVAPVSSTQQPPTSDKAVDTSTNDRAVDTSTNDSEVETSSNDRAVDTSTNGKAVVPPVPSPAAASPSRRVSPVSSEAVDVNAPREGRVALVLRINKELIRVCVELQKKEMTSDPLFREVAVRLQGNLGYLAGIADKNGKASADTTSRSASASAAIAQQSVPPKLEPFPQSSHAPSLPALYEKLIAMFQHAAPSPSEAQKRSRDVSTDSQEARKRIATPDTTAEKPANGNTEVAASIPEVSASVNFAHAPPVPISSPSAAPPNNPQAQALVQAFGPNALANLHALQTHMRGQGKHPWVSFMEANVPNFTSLPLQVQMQQLTAMQISAQQQRQQQQGASPANHSSSPHPPQLGQSVHSPMTSGARIPSTSSSTGGSPGVRGLSGFASPAGTRPGSSGSGSGRPRTASQQFDFDPAFNNVASPSTSSEVTPNMPKNIPPHLQQQLRQQYYAQMQLQQQQQQDAPQQQQQQTWNYPSS